MPRRDRQHGGPAAWTSTPARKPDGVPSGIDVWGGGLTWCSLRRPRSSAEGPMVVYELSVAQKPVRPTDIGTVEAAISCRFSGGR